MHKSRYQSFQVLSIFFLFSYFWQNILSLIVDISITYHYNCFSTFNYSVFLDDDICAMLHFQCKYIVKQIFQVQGFCNHKELAVKRQISAPCLPDLNKFMYQDDLNHLFSYLKWKYKILQNFTPRILQLCNTVYWFIYIQYMTL